MMGGKPTTCARKPSRPQRCLSPESSASRRKMIIQSIHEAVLDQRPDGRKAVAPGDLLAFRKIASVIRDRHLVEFMFALEHLGGDLRLEIEAVRPDLEI